MKKTLFALEVLLMLSALPFFCGLAMTRKDAVPVQEQAAASATITKQNTEAIVVKPLALDNS